MIISDHSYYNFVFFDKFMKMLMTLLADMMKPCRCLCDKIVDIFGQSNTSYLDQQSANDVFVDYGLEHYE